MNVRTLLRTLATASLLALVALSLPGVSAHAMPIQEARKKACLARGYVWSDKLGCADKGCSLWDGKSEPGDTVSTPGGHVSMCNGWTGQWEQVLIRSGGSSVVPAPAGTVHVP